MDFLFWGEGFLSRTQSLASIDLSVPKVRARARACLHMPTPRPACSRGLRHLCGQRRQNKNLTHSFHNLFPSDGVPLVCLSDTNDMYNRTKQREVIARAEDYNLCRQGLADRWNIKGIYDTRNLRRGLGFTTNLFEFGIYDGRDPVLYGLRRVCTIAAVSLDNTTQCEKQTCFVPLLVMRPKTCLGRWRSPTGFERTIDDV